MGTSTISVLCNLIGQTLLNDRYSCYIITFNKKDFVGVEKFGIKILTPKKFLEKIGGI